MLHEGSGSEDDQKHSWSKLTNILTRITSSFEAYYEKLKYEQDDGQKEG